MDLQHLRKSPWRDVLAEVAAQQNLLESLLHSEPDSRNDDGAARRSASPSPGGERAPGRVSRWDGTAARRSRALISPSPERHSTTVSRGTGAATARGGADSLATDLWRSTASPARSSTRETSRAVNDLVEALSTSSWSSSDGESGTPLDGTSTPRRNTLGPSDVPHATQGSPSGPCGDGAVPDAAHSRSEAVDVAQRFLKATRVVASEFEARQRIVFAEFAELTELLSRFVCGVATA
ncbi:hypothetical protein NESM_000601200 [Novymonas esmeraldas]|uniref:Uncharacterized protein n=1 Tax=Novymonas esmeraldas TaxID=1808958 RepID=A0AAW0ET78_9TRYP